MIQPQVVKVLQQSHSIAQYHPKAQQDILWPCLCFSISLQARGQQSLNLFESTLLRLLADGGRDLDKINQLMGFTPEDKQSSSLAEFLSLKLQQLNLLTERLDLTAEGRDMVNRLDKSEPQVVSATVYFDLVNRCWLPMISRGDLQLTHAQIAPNGEVELIQGSVGRSKKITAIPIIDNAEKNDDIRPPTEREVIDIIRLSRQQKKKLKLIADRTGGDGFMTSSGTISVNSEAELVYLHCYAFAVASVRSFYVSNGFLSTTQDRFSRGFNDPRKEAQYPGIKVARERLNNRRKKSHQRRFMIAPKSLEKLYDSLVGAKVSNVSEQIEFENNLTEFLSRSYAELELILAECFPFSNLETCIKALHSDPIRNGHLALDIARELGFQINNDKLIKPLIKANKGSVVYLKAEQPVMTPLLVCHLLIAQIDEQQPMAKLAKEYPSLLNEIAKLRSWRNPIDHGDLVDVRDKAKPEDVEFTHQLVNKVRQILTGWTKALDGRVPDQNVPKWHQEDIRTKAHAKLEDEFGLMRTRMDDRVYQGLFDSLVLAHSIDGRGRTNALASALQHALYKSCQSLDPSDARDIELVKTQLTKMGINQLTKSNVHKVKLALNGGNATLGANFIAFWAQLTEQQQRELKRPDSLIESVDKLDKIRGHSGEILDQHEALNEIEKSVFTLIKRLMEQYCG